jgi:Ca-activated chloride channel family protein
VKIRREASQIPMNAKAKRMRLHALVILALALVVGWMGSAEAQQGGFVEIPSHPLNQSQGGGVLVMPSMPAPQTGSVATLPQRQIPEQAPQTGDLSIPSNGIRNQQGYAQTTVTVTDQDGRYITGLQKSDFKLYVDGMQRDISFFRQDSNTPVSVGILVDTSGSMEPKLPQAEAAISELIRNLNDEDDVFLIAFSSRPFVLQEFTTNHELVLNRLELLHAFGQTSLYDTVIQGLLMVRHGRWDKKALVVITDGMDNTSQATLDEVGAQARRMGVLVYAIGIGDANPSNVPMMQIGPFAIGDDSNQVDAATLQMLSSESGGKTFLMHEVGDGAALRAACEQISHELRQQYTIGFIAPDASRGGYRNLHVDVPTRPEARVRTRKGVEIGATESASADGESGSP